ncbi:MAG: DUF4129 domain-containing protein [Actinomycetota bacterium]
MAAVLLIGVPVGARADTAVTASGYVERLRDALSIARVGEASPTIARMQAIRDDVGPVAVASGGDTVPIPADAFLYGLPGTAASDFRRAGRHVSSLIEAARGALRPPAVPPGSIRSTLGPAYRNISANPGAGSRFRRWFGNVADAIRRGIGAIAGPGNVVLWVALVLLTVAATLLVRRFGVHVVPESQVDRVPAQRGVDWQRLSDEALARGDLTEAIRALYHVLLDALTARGVIPDAPSITAGDCRRAVSVRRPALATAVGDATGVFERVVYGGAAAHPEQIDVLRGAARAAGAR